MRKHFDRNATVAALIFTLLMLGVRPALAGAGTGVTTIELGILNSTTCR